MNNQALISNISKIYTNALFQTYSDISSAKVVGEQLYDVCNLFNSDADLGIIMNNPVISLSKKHEILNDVFLGKIDDKLLRFLNLLIDKNRISELNSICSCYAELLDRLDSMKNVEVYSSYELDNSIKLEIIKRVEKKLGSAVRITWGVNKDLIAGLLFIVDGNVIDTSVGMKLKNISKNMLR